jgi:hypothetical protein
MNDCGNMNAVRVVIIVFMYTMLMLGVVLVAGVVGVN